MPTARPIGVFLIAVFFAVATCVLVGVGTALLFPGSAMEEIWRLYPARRALLMPYHDWLGPAFLILAVVMLAASIGCFRQREWGWWLAVAIFAVKRIWRCGADFPGAFPRRWRWGRRRWRDIVPFVASEGAEFVRLSQFDIRRFDIRLCPHFRFGECRPCDGCAFLARSLAWLGP